MHVVYIYTSHDTLDYVLQVQEIEEEILRRDEAQKEETRRRREVLMKCLLITYIHLLSFIFSFKIQIKQIDALTMMRPSFSCLFASFF